MTLGTGNIVQQATGTTASGTTHVVTLPGGTTAGNTVIVAGFLSGLGSFTAPTGTGWVLDSFSAGNLAVNRLSNVGAGATTWTFTTGSADVSAWYAAEVSGLDSDPLDAVIRSLGSVVNGGTLSATAPITVGRSTVGFAFYGTTASAGIAHSWASWTGGFVEQADIGTSGLQGIAAAVAFATDTLVYSTTATLTTTASTASAATIITYRETGTPIVSPLTLLAGMEWGTPGGTGLGLTSGTLGVWNNSTAPTGTWNTNWTVATTSARNSVYGLRVVQSAAAAFVRVGSGQPLGYICTAGFNVRVISATGVVVVAETVQASTRTAQLVYDATATKFGVRSGTTGTIQYQPGTTALNTWVWIDLRVITNATTWTADWRIETASNTYTAQTQATLAGQVPANHSYLAVGSNTSQTVTCDFDDIVISPYSKPYPLGPHEVKILLVDPSGTLTVSGTTANFNTFTANGTLAAWNATTARGAIGELPPTVSASADGLVQVTIAASDYVEMPMQTYALAAKEVVAGVRMYASTWGTSAGGVATFSIRGWQGSIETNLIPVATAFAPGQPTSMSATTPIWRVAMWPSTGGWTQAKLDAAAVRFGFSTDVAPGLSAVYLEIAVAKAVAHSLFGDMAIASLDPNLGGIVAIDVTAPAMGTGDTSLVYEEAGSPTTVPVPEGTLVTSAIGAAFDEDVNRVTLVWPPEPDPIGGP